MGRTEAPLGVAPAGRAQRGPSNHRGCESRSQQQPRQGPRGQGPAPEVPLRLGLVEVPPTLEIARGSLGLPWAGEAAAESGDTQPAPHLALSLGQRALCLEPPHSFRQTLPTHSRFPCSPHCSQKSLAPSLGLSCAMGQLGVVLQLALGLEARGQGSSQHAQASLELRNVLEPWGVGPPGLCTFHSLQAILGWARRVSLPLRRLSTRAPS